MAPPPSPWPRLRESWWVFALAGVALVVFALALVEDVRCGLGRCSGTWAERLFTLDAVGGLPRLFTTGLFVAAAVLAWLARGRSAGRAQLWWTAMAGVGAVLVVAKLVSAHSTAKGSSPMATLVVGVVLAAVALGVLAATGRRWGVAATRPVVLALGGYAATALGVDAVVALLIALQDGVGLLIRAAGTFAEELGEALAALILLVTLRWHLPAGSSAPLEPELSTRPHRG